MVGTLSQCNTSFYGSCAAAQCIVDRNLKLHKSESHEAFKMWRHDLRGHYWTLSSESVLKGARSFWLLDDCHAEAPQSTPIDTSGEALHSCTAALAEVDPQMSLLTDKLFQVNRILVQAPTSKDALVT